MKREVELLAFKEAAAVQRAGAAWRAADVERKVADQARLWADAEGRAAEEARRAYDVKTKGLRTELAAARGLLNMHGAAGACHWRLLGAWASTCLP